MPSQKWIVTFGQSLRVFFTAYHAAQFTRALDMNKTPYTVAVINLLR